MYTTVRAQHRILLIIFSLVLQTIVIALVRGETELSYELIFLLRLIKCHVIDRSVIASCDSPTVYETELKTYSFNHAFS